MRIVAIAGVGLIGGSFGLALRAAGFTGSILGVSRPQTIEQAIELGAIDRGVSLEEAAEAADLLFLAQPVSVILETLNRLAPFVRSECLVTDAGSTKKEIVERAKQVLPGEQFLGGHPMAGKEARGIAVADAELFRGRTYVLTPHSAEQMATLSVRGFVGWIEKCGGIPLQLDAGEHDRIVAFTSHLPQLMSTALGAVLSQQLNDIQQFRVSGSGLHDALRLALSDWNVWRDICKTNSEHLTHALQVYIDKLTEMRENLQTQRLETEWTAATNVASVLRRPHGFYKLEEEGE